MRLLELQIVGYRSFKDVTWVPGSLNVLIGPNGSGKTNLVKVLELLAVAANGGLGAHIQREGGMGSISWDGKTDNIRFRLETSPVEEGRSIERDSLTYELELSRIGKTAAYSLNKELLANYYRVRHEGQAQPFKLLDRDPRKANIFDEEQRSFSAHESVRPDETLLSLAGGPFAQNRHVAAFKTQLGSWTTYQVIETQRNAPIRQAVVSTQEKVVLPDGQNLTTVLHTLYASDRRFMEEVNLGMKAAFGDDFERLSFPPDADQRVSLRVFWRNLTKAISAAELSDGTLRFLFLLAVLANPDPPPLIVIEEPEVGLHPKMLPIIAEYAADAALRAQVVFTTHSPDFLNAFPKKSIPKTTVFEWDGGETIIRVPPEDELRYWLQEYSLGDLQRSGQLESFE